MNVRATIDIQDVRERLMIIHVATMLGRKQNRCKFNGISSHT
jgi:hypothetical protein